MNPEKTTSYPHLTTEEAKARQEKWGKNELTAKKANPWWRILGRQFSDILVVILLVSAAISLFVGEATDAAVILFIVLLNSSIGFFQEFKTEKTLEALKKMIHPEIRVIRDNREFLIATSQLVPGDLVILAEGDRIPADGILLKSNQLKIEESALTGESLALEKKDQEEVYMGTIVVHGSGILQLTKIGMQTKFGEIAKLTTETKQVKSPLQKELGYIGHFVAKVTLLICSILFIIGFLRSAAGDSFLDKLADSLIFSVSVAIAAVPEGLPTAITVALALGASALSRKKAIVKRLSSVETLGAVTTICSDKTGTLTKNEMTAREIFLADLSIYQVTGVGYDYHRGQINFLGGHENPENKRLKKKLLSICAKCNEAKISENAGVYSVLGDPTEGALLTLALKEQEQLHRETTAIFPFDSDRKMMSVLTRENEVLVKGSPDQVLEKCQFWYDGDQVVPLDEHKKGQITKHYQRMAQNALRVLAFAFRQFDPKNSPENSAQAESDLVFCGLVGMIDPPRGEVAQAVKQCHTAGIRIVVITGDYGITAEAIAKELGITKGKKAQVLTGSEVEKLDDQDLKTILHQTTQPVIFARSLPAQKMRIVRLLQNQGEIVAMTGDGVNDAPALKKADIGIAMGITGTEVSKEAAVMVLTNDSFASIVKAVEEGRRIYDNLQKFIWFMFACNIGELFVVFAAIIFQFPLPLTAILILAVDLGTDILPAIALGVDTPEKGLMQRKPRDPESKVMNKRFVKYFLLVGSTIGITVTLAFLLTIYNDGWNYAQGPNDNPWRHAQTVAFASLVFVQLLNTYSARSEKRSVFNQPFFDNHFLTISIFSSVLLALMMIYLPFFNRVLKTSPLTAFDWLVVTVATIIPFIVIEIRKAILRKREGLI